MPEIQEVLQAVEGYHEEIKAVADEVAEMQDRLDKFEARANRPLAPGSSQKGDLAAEQKAIGMYVKTEDDVELKQLQVGLDPEGGYVVLPVVSERIRAQLRDSVAMRRLARIRTIETGDAWVEPREGERDAAAEWVGETAPREETDFHDLGMTSYPLREIMAKVLVTQKLLDLSFVDVGAWVEEKVSDKFSRAENQAFITGNHPLQPRGLLSYESTGEADFVRAHGKWGHVWSGAADTIVADSLRNIFWSLRAPYRGNSTWLMSSATANLLDLMKDGQGQWLWRNGMTAGAPPSLLGRPVEIDESMPEVAAGTTPVAFGDFQRGYYIVERPGLKMLRDPYTAKPSVKFYGYKRTTGGGADFHAIRLLKVGVGE